jgi:hypothetical protein
MPASPALTSLGGLGPAFSNCSPGVIVKLADHYGCTVDSPRTGDLRQRIGILVGQSVAEPEDVLPLIVLVREDARR